MTTQSSDIQYLDNTTALQSFCSAIAHHTVISLDTEFLREKTYYSKLCLIQLAAGNEIAIIDPLRIDDLQPLYDLLYNPNIVKVLHAARQDLEIFHHLRGKLPHPIFDTQIAANLLGFNDQIGYANLVDGMLKVQLEKTHTRTDWSQRPLDPEQISYAADDVRYLHQIYPMMQTQLAAQGRSDWLVEDFTALSDPKLYENEPTQQWQRVSGSMKLRGVQLAILQQLAAWREREAQRLDRPRKWLLNDDILLTIVRMKPKDIEGLGKVRGLNDGQIRQFGGELIRAVQQAIAMPSSEWPQATEFDRLSAEQESLVDLMMAVLRHLAVRQNLSPAILASRKDLERLVLGKDTELLHGWRGRLAGKQLRELLAGHIQVTIDNGQLNLQTTQT